MYIYIYTYNIYETAERQDKIQFLNSIFTHAENNFSRCLNFETAWSHHSGSFFLTNKKRWQFLSLSKVRFKRPLKSTFGMNL